MDAKIPELGSGVESADCSIEYHNLHVNEIAGWRHPNKPSRPYSIGICIIAKKLQSYSGDQVWAAPTKKQIVQGLNYHAKILKKMYKTFQRGYTINAKKSSTGNRQQEVIKTDKNLLHI